MKNFHFLHHLFVHDGKIHYKTYKAHKHWLYAVIATFGVAGSLGLGPDHTQAVTNDLAPASQPATAATTATQPTSIETNETMAPSQTATTAEATNPATTSKDAPAPQGSTAADNALNLDPVPENQVSVSISADQPAKTTIEPGRNTSESSYNTKPSPQETATPSTRTETPLNSSSQASTENDMVKNENATQNAQTPAATANNDETTRPPTTETPVPTDETILADKKTADGVVSKANETATEVNKIVTAINDALKKPNFDDPTWRNQLQAQIDALNAVPDPVKAGQAAADAISSYQDQLKAYQASTKITQPPAIETVTVGDKAQPAEIETYQDLLKQFDTQMKANTAVIQNNLKIGALNQVQADLLKAQITLQTTVDQLIQQAHTGTISRTDLDSLKDQKAVYDLVLKKYNDAVTTDQTQQLKPIETNTNGTEDPTQNSSQALFDAFLAKLQTVSQQQQAQQKYNDLEKLYQKIYASPDPLNTFNLVNSAVITWQAVIRQYNAASNDQATLLADITTAQDNLESAITEFFQNQDYANYQKLRAEYETSLNQLPNGSKEIVSYDETTDPLQQTLKKLLKMIEDNQKAQRDYSQVLNKFNPVAAALTVLNSKLTELQKLSDAVNDTAKNWQQAATTFNDAMIATYDASKVLALAPIAQAYAQARINYMQAITGTQVDLTHMPNFEISTTYLQTDKTITGMLQALGVAIDQYNDDLEHSDLTNADVYKITLDTAALGKTLADNVAAILNEADLVQLNATLTALQDITPDLSNEQAVRHRNATNYYTISPASSDHFGNAFQFTEQDHYYPKSAKSLYNNIMNPGVSVVTSTPIKTFVSFIPTQIAKAGINPHETQARNQRFVGSVASFVINKNDPDIAKYITLSEDGKFYIVNNGAGKTVTISTEQVNFVDPDSTKQELIRHKMAGLPFDSAYFIDDIGEEDASDFHLQQTYSLQSINYYLAGYAISYANSTGAPDFAKNSEIIPLHDLLSRDPGELVMSTSSTYLPTIYFYYLQVPDATKEVPIHKSWGEVSSLATTLSPALADLTLKLPSSLQAADFQPQAAPSPPATTDSLPSLKFYAGASVAYQDQQGDYVLAPLVTLNAPNLPAKPGSPDQPLVPPTEPGKPGEPTAPNDPPAPPTSENPHVPNLPGEPDKPVEPENPKTPKNPKTPNLPPNQPGEPPQPADPPQPNTPSTPGIPSIPEAASTTSDTEDHAGSTPEIVIDHAHKIFATNQSLIEQSNDQVRPQVVQSINQGQIQHHQLQANQTAKNLPQTSDKHEGYLAVLGTLLVALSGLIIGKHHKKVKTVK